MTEEYEDDVIAEEQADKQDEEDVKEINAILDLKPDDEAPEGVEVLTLPSLMKSWGTPELKFLSKDITTSNLMGKAGDSLFEVTNNLKTYNAANIFGAGEVFGAYWKDNAEIVAVTSKGHESKFLDNAITQKAELKKSGLMNERGDEKWKKM